MGKQKLVGGGESRQSLASCLGTAGLGSTAGSGDGRMFPVHLDQKEGKACRELWRHLRCGPVMNPSWWALSPVFLILNDELPCSVGAGTVPYHVALAPGA